MDGIVVNGYETATSNNKDYIVFDISVTIDGIKHQIKQRYSELLQIHKGLKCKFYGQLPVFPPKQVLTFNTKNLESRKRALNNYLQAVFFAVDLHEILLDYLKIPRLFSNSYAISSESFDDATESTHSPIVQANKEEVNESSYDGDTVIKGVMQAMYNSEIQF